MIAVSGTIKYESVESIIESIVRIEGTKNPIPGLDQDDVAQEIRIECIRVLKFYDSSRIGPSPYKFLQVCIRNFLYNMRRGIYVPNNPPCVRCPLWDKPKKLCLIDEIGCDKIIKYRQNMSKKAALYNPTSIEPDTITQNEDIDAFLLDESIKSTLPHKYLTHYNNMKIGKSNLVPVHVKRYIRAVTKDILDNA